jgi:Xaa-Pro aminopeptidase
MKSVTEKIKELRLYMKAEKLDAYIITTDDFHGSEYVGAYFRASEYITGFTGSAGTCVVTEDEACLWTDGRYFIQAAEQLAGTPVKLMKSGMEGVPSIEEYLCEKLCGTPADVRIGFDGRTVTASFVKKLEKALEKTKSEKLLNGNILEKPVNSGDNKKIEYIYNIDLVDKVWDNRPELSAEPVWRLSEEYAGVPARDKLAEVRKSMKEQGADYYVITALDEIAWLLNLRGNDVECNPVFLSYMLIDNTSAVLYANKDIFDEDIKRYLQDTGVVIKPYDNIYEDISNIVEIADTTIVTDTIKTDDITQTVATDNKTGISSEIDIVDKKIVNITLLLDENSVNYKIISSIPENVNIIYKDSPVKLMKAIKNKTECENIRKAHIKDGVAVTRFIYWLKHIHLNGITELDTVKKLEEFRKESEGYLGISFDTISAYGPHGAIVHYEPTEDTDIPVEPSGLLLVDSGGHYMEGTTDITRTITMGPVSEEEKKAFTLVLMGHLNLAATHFPYGVRGENLDGIAREPLWRYGMDFNHGTGHGVGYLLNVHEGPQRISYKTSETAPKGAVFEAGMVTSDEPGLYVEGKFGIRHENLLLCVEDAEGFLRFETLTFVPFDRDAIDTAYMSDRELDLLNTYHQQVYEKISPYLEGEECEWLYEVTRPLHK